MPTDNPAAPRKYQRVMVLSTITDPKQHWEQALKAIDAQNVKVVRMEHDSPTPAEAVLDLASEFVGARPVCVAVISHRYGLIPECLMRGPNHALGPGDPWLPIVDDSESELVYANSVSSRCIEHRPA